MSHRPRSVVLTLLTVAVLAFFALTAPAGAYLVHDATTSVWKPDVADELIVWEDQDYNGDIWAKGLTGAAFPIWQDGWGYSTAPAVDDTTVVWQDDGQIRGATVDLETHAVSAFAIATSAGAKSDPDISGRYVVWVDATNGNQDIYAYDLLTEDQFAICTHSAKQEAPAISGTLVVWRDFRYNSVQGDIYAARLTPGSYSVEEFPVHAQTSGANYLEAQPAVGGGVVAWVDQRLGTGTNSMVYAAPVIGTSVGAEWQVSQTSTRGVDAPAVNGTLIAWTYTGGGTNQDVYARRTDLSPEFALAATTDYETHASIGKSRTAWSNRSTWNIYAADIGGFGWGADILVAGGAPHTVTRDVTLTLTAASSAGPATEMAFSNNGIDWTSWESYATSRAWQVPTGDGTKTVYVQFKDAEGNVSPVKSDAILLDENAPVTTDDAPLGWATGDVTVTLTPDDHGGSGVQTTVYRIDGSGVDTYPGQIVVSGEGIHTVEYCSVDKLGHTEDWKSATVKIDLAPPTTGDDAGDGWHGSGFTLHLEAHDANGVDRTEYSVDGGVWQTGTSRSFSAGGRRNGAARSFTVRYRSVDVAGRVEEAQTCVVRVDGRRPTTTCDADAPPHAEDVVVTLDPADAHSGVRETWYSLDGEDWAEGTSVLVPAPQDHSMDGWHTIRYYSVDNVGNVGYQRTAMVLIDTVGGAGARVAGLGGAGTPATHLKMKPAGRGARLRALARRGV